VEEAKCMNEGRECERSEREREREREREMCVPEGTVGEVERTG